MILESGFLTAYIFSIVFILGIVFGSFINCMAWRIANGEKVSTGRSHCTSCNHELSAGDLVPVFSYLFLKGKCRYCHTKIAPRYMLVELLLGIVFMMLLAAFGLTWQTLSYMILSCLLLGLSLVDLNIFEIPDGFIVTGIINWLIFLPLTSGIVGPTWLSNPAVEVPKDYFIHQLTSGVVGGSTIAGSLLLLSIIFDKLTGKESLGGGDIKLYFMTGLYMGVLESLFCLILSCILGIIFSLFAKKERIPFGPFISVAVLITLFIGSTVTGWYLSLF